MITLCIYSVGALHVVADYISFATTFLFKKSSLIHSVAPPLQTEPAALGFGLVLGKPFGWAHLYCLTIKSRQRKRWRLFYGSVVYSCCVVKLIKEINVMLLQLLTYANMSF